MEQGNLFDKPEKPKKETTYKLPDWRAERDDGMQRAEEHAREVWHHAACTVLQYFIDTHETFSGWQITAALRAKHITTPTDRALGPLLIHAAKCGMIEKTGVHEPNPLAHGCPSPVWRSLRYKR
jgi:hypothetical protein